MACCCTVLPSTRVAIPNGRAIEPLWHPVVIAYSVACASSYVTISNVPVHAGIRSAGLQQRPTASSSLHIIPVQVVEVDSTALRYRTSTAVQCTGTLDTRIMIYSVVVTATHALIPALGLSPQWKVARTVLVPCTVAFAQSQRKLSTV